jgi:cysteinyl-tRNA synthetase
VAISQDKKNPTDFALWKFSSMEEKREQEWESPWGKGFPGWHIECSAMGAKYLGHHFDVHTGGIDHIPTHHNNEIAQSESVFGKKHVNYWLHCAHITIDGKKISKSLGNTVLPKDLEDKNISMLGLRYWFLTSHYKTTTNFTWDAINGAMIALNRIYTAIQELGQETGTPIEAYLNEFYDAWADDLNTPQAVAILHKLLKDTAVAKGDKKATLFELDKMLGLSFDKITPSSQVGTNPALIPDKLPKEAIELLTKRKEARVAKDWKESDEIRQKLLDLGYIIKDTPKGQEIYNKE